MTATDKRQVAHSPFAEREENHCKVISGTLPFVVWTTSDEVVSAVCEVELCEIDGEASDEANPESNPQGFAPKVAWNQHRQSVHEQEQNFIIAASILTVLINQNMTKNKYLLVLKHDVFVGLDVIHVNSFHFFLTFWMEAEAIPADMREEKSSAEIQRILDRFSEFVMHAVNLNPVVNFKIKCNYIK